MNEAIVVDFFKRKYELEKDVSIHAVHQGKLAAAFGKAYAGIVCPELIQ